MARSGSLAFERAGVTPDEIDVCEVYDAFTPMVLLSFEALGFCKKGDGGPFVEGGTIRGKITYPGYEHLTMELQVQRIEPERYFSYRWHPYAIDPNVDYSNEPTTLVEFRLTERDGGTDVEVVESGFDALPAHRRDEAFRMNSQGWEQQMVNIRHHVG